MHTVGKMLVTFIILYALWDSLLQTTIVSALWFDLTLGVSVGDNDRDRLTCHVTRSAHVLITFNDAQAI